MTHLLELDLPAPVGALAGNPLMSVQLTFDAILRCDTLLRKKTGDLEPLPLLNVCKLAGYDQDGLPDKEFMFAQCALPSKCAWRTELLPKQYIKCFSIND